MAAVEDVWATMKVEAEKNLQAQKQKMKKTQEVASKSSRGGGGCAKTGGGVASDSIEALLAKAEAAERAAKAQAKKDNKERKALIAAALSSADSGPAVTARKTEDAPVSVAVTTTASAPVLISAKDAMQDIARHLSSAANTEDQGARRRGLQHIYDALFVRNVLDEADYSELFQDVCRPIFQRFADPVEKCRELALRITDKFFERSADLTLTIGYFIPALNARSPSTWAYDEEMKVFVADLEAHEAYRRGKAVARQDKADLLTHTVVEPSEEIRLLACRCLSTLVRRLCGMGAAAVLHPYFHEIVMYTQAQLRDPFPDLKQCACELLLELCRHEDFAAGMKYFAVGLCRAVLPVMRHRHAKVRVAALATLSAVMCVPDRAKMKGSGTEAIMDLVGFREENNLSVAAFYVSDVSVNYLAEVVQDSVMAVRLKAMEMLVALLTEIGDRYDHQTRLLPYVLDLLCDEAGEVSALAMRCLQRCGQQYEEDHHDEIIERRQYGVDGDRRINVDKRLPEPFDSAGGRPRLGMRLYVRGNCKRFLSALMAELTNWIGTTRLKSANLLKIVVIFMEEHLTMEAHVLIPGMIKALGFAAEDHDPTLRKILLETYELVGRFMLPEVYVHYLLPRLLGDPAVVQFGVDVATRVTVLEFLGAVLSGSRTSEIAPLFENLVSALTDPFAISQDSARTMCAALGVMKVLLSSMVDRGKAAVEAHFLNTGRLTSLRGAVSKAFGWLCTALASAEMRASASACLALLAQLDRDSVSTDHTPESLRALFCQHGGALLSRLLAGLDCAGDDWAGTQVLAERQLLQLLVGGPWCLPLASSGSAKGDGARLEQLLACVSEAACGLRGDYDGPHKTEVLCFLSDLLLTALAPLVHRTYSPLAAAAAACSHLSLASTGGPGPGQPSTLWPGAATVLGEEASRSLRALARRKLPVLLEVFVLHDRWATSRTLQTRRLHVLCRLLGVDSEGEEDGEGGGVEGDGEEKSVAAAWGPLLLASDLCPPASVPAATAGQLLLLSLELPLRAGVPHALRLLGVRVARALLSRLSRCFCADAAAFERCVRPASYWLLLQQQEQSEQEQEQVRQPYDVHQRRIAQASAAAGVACLLQLLDDSSDRVRVWVLRALQAAVPLLPSPLPLPLPSDTDAPVAAAAAGNEQAADGASSAAVCRRLLSCLVADAPRGQGSGSSAADSTAAGDWNDVEAVRVELESALRLLAVLDPSALLPMIGEAAASLPPLSEEARCFRAPLPPCHEIVHGLRDHCQLLAQFRK